MSLDTMQGRTARFARLDLRVHHGAEAHAVTALALLAGAKPNGLVLAGPGPDELLNRSGLSRSDAQRCIDALREDKYSLVLLTAPAGRSAHDEPLAVAVAELAHACRAKLLPLYAWGASAGTCAAAQKIGLTDTSAWLKACAAGEFSTAFVVGADLFGDLPGPVAVESLGGLDQLIAASAMPNRTTERADIVLPLAFWFEMNGDLTDHAGSTITLAALGAAPGGAATPTNLMSQLAQAARLSPVTPREVTRSQPAPVAGAGGDVPAADLPAPTTAPDAFVLTSRTETLELYEGAVSRQLDWPLTIEPQPVVLVNPADAARLQLADRQVVSLTTAAGQAQLAARITEAVPAGTVAAPATVPEVGRLFDWRINGAGITMGPTSATITPAPLESRE